MRMPLLFLLCAVGGASFAACKHDEPNRPAVLVDGPAAPGVSGSSGSAGDAGGTTDASTPVDAGACTDLESSSVEVDQNAVAGDVPAGTGGTISDGVYDLTEASIYVGASGLPGPTGTRIQETMRITGTKLERVQTTLNSANASSTGSVSGTITVNGTSATLAVTCPTGNQETVTYTATATGLTLSNLVTKESLVYSHRQ
jgi:hypothetical protein